MENKNYLIHHGILGQKWGVRRYQNYDGSLKAAGAQRYRINTSGTKSPGPGKQPPKSNLGNQVVKRVATSATYLSPYNKHTPAGFTFGRQWTGLRDAREAHQEVINAIYDYTKSVTGRKPVTAQIRDITASQSHISEQYDKLENHTQNQKLYDKYKDSNITDRDVAAAHKVYNERMDNLYREYKNIVDGSLLTAGKAFTGRENPSYAVYKLDEAYREYIDVLDAAAEAKELYDTFTDINHDQKLSVKVEKLVNNITSTVSNIANSVVDSGKKFLNKLFGK